MRTSDICPTCSTFSNALCTLYNGAYLPTLDINTLDSLETALIKIEAYSTTVSPTALGDLTDVNLTGLADNQVIQYDAGTATWIPVELVTLDTIQTITESKTFTATQTFNSATSFNIDILYAGTGVSVLQNNSGTGTAYYTNNLSSGVAYLANGGAAATGFNFVGQNNGSNTFTVNKTGDIIANTVNGVSLTTGGSAGLFLNEQGNYVSAAGPTPTLQTVLNAGNSASGGSNFFQLDMSAGTGFLFSSFDNGTYSSTLEQDEDQITALVVDGANSSQLFVLTGSVSLKRTEGVNSSEFFVVSPKAQSVNFNLETPTGTANGTTYTVPLSVHGVFADSDGDIAPYLVYTALISQVGAAAPTAIVLQNTLGVTISFARSIAGVYTATASGVAFTSNKTAIILPSTVNNNDGNPSVANSRWNSTTVIDIWTADIDNAGVVYNDDCLNNTMLEIRVYP